jgi:hypothetical protein
MMDNEKDIDALILAEIEVIKADLEAQSRSMEQSIACLDRILRRLEQRPHVGFEC